jgi:hypothetical protein
LFLAIIILFVFPAVSFSETPSIAPATGSVFGRVGLYPAAVPITGKTPRTWQVTVDNTARTLDNLVVTGSGTYLGGSDNTLTPIAATISCETTDTQWAFTTTPTADLGHVLAAGSSWQPSGPDALALLRGRNTADGASASCAVTLWY